MILEALPFDERSEPLSQNQIRRILKDQDDNGGWGEPVIRRYLRMLEDGALIKRFSLKLPGKQKYAVWRLTETGNEIAIKSKEQRNA